MTKTKLYIIAIVGIIALSFSCKPKLTCAAYHSHFFLFPEVQDKYFSLFEENDSSFVPKENLATTNKLWNGISTGPNGKKSYKKRHYIIPMKDVYKEVEGADSSFGTSAINTDSIKSDNKRFSN